MELKTSRDYRRLGGTISDYLKRIADLENGIYAITDEQKEIFKIIEGMDFLQWHFNKGVRVLGFEGNTNKVEIYNKQAKQDEIDRSLEDFNL